MCMQYACATPFHVGRRRPTGLPCLQMPLCVCRPRSRVHAAAGLDLEAALILLLDRSRWSVLQLEGPAARCSNGAAATHMQGHQTVCQGVADGCVARCSEVSQCLQSNETKFSPDFDPPGTQVHHLAWQDNRKLTNRQVCLLPLPRVQLQPTHSWEGEDREGREGGMLCFLPLGGSHPLSIGSCHARARSYCHADGSALGQSTHCGPQPLELTCRAHHSPPGCNYPAEAWRNAHHTYTARCTRMQLWASWPSPAP